MKKMLLAAAAGSLLLQGTALAAPSEAGAGNISLPTSIDAGAQLNRFQDDLEKIEWERAAQEGFRQREDAQVQTEEQRPEAPALDESITFQLNKVQVDESRVLSPESINNITAKYEGQEVSLNQLYEIVDEINKLYDEQGYITCSAGLKPQKIENGVVCISLLESSVGEAVISGNENTDRDYILDRLPLKEGKILSRNKLNSDIIRFHGTNDVGLHISLKAGEKEGTTDYYIQVREPKKTGWNIFTDNTGSESSGEYRLGMFYTDHSLSGLRDSLNLGTVFSKGTTAFNANYSYPLGHSGTKLNLSYSTNRVDQIKNASVSKVVGRSQSYSLGITQPWIITDTYRSDLSLEYGHQTSKSDFELVKTGDKLAIVDDTITNWTVGLAMTNYGKDAVFFQRHSLSRGQSNSTPAIGGNRAQDFSLYKLSAFYQKAYSNGNMLSFRADGQYSFTDYLISSRQYSIGGMYSVRGYQESYMSGDGGINLSTEYTIPLRKDRRLQGFWFFDYGRVFGKAAEANGSDRQLYSTGIGFRATLGSNISSVLTFGVPLKRSFEAKTEKADPFRVNFMISGQF